MCSQLIDVVRNLAIVERYYCSSRRSENYTDLREHPQIVLLDLMIPKMTGVEMLERIMQFDPAIDVLLMTTLLDRDCGRSNPKGRQRHRALQLDSELLDTSQFERMIGRSPLMWDLFARTRRGAADGLTAAHA